MFEDLAIYQIRIRYHEDWKVYILSDIQRLKGDIAFAPIKDSGKQWRIVLSWRPLESSRKKYSSADEQAKETIIQLAKAKQVQSHQVIDHKSIELGGHEAVFYNLMVKYYKRGGLLKQNVADCVIRFVLLYCPESKRCMMLYEESDYPIEQERIFEDVMKSFSCHSTVR